MSEKNNFLHIDYTDTQGEGYSLKVSVTSKCPTCLKEWTRYEYEQSIMTGSAFRMCFECVKQNSDENGNFLITLFRPVEDDNDT